MKKEFSVILKNIFKVAVANIFSLIVSVVTTLLLPKALGVEQYALWQMYLLYSNYIIYSSLGFCDGIYLKYGGQKILTVNKAELKTQFTFFYIYELVISGVIATVGGILIEEINTKFCFVMAVIQAIIFVFRIAGLNFLQSVNEIQKYAKATVTERLLFFFFILGICVFVDYNYAIIIGADIIAKFISMILTFFYLREIYQEKLLPFKTQITEIKNIIKSGFKLYSSSLAEVVLNSGFRFFIVDKWGLTVFGKTSLTFSISNLASTLLNSVSIAMFPVMRNKKNEEIKNIYYIMKNGMMYIALLVLFLYLPISYIIDLWLPQYEDSIAYMAILFPVCIFQTENNLINNTIFKTLNREKNILNINIGFTILSLSGLFLGVFILNDLNISLLYFVICMALRCLWGQRIIDNILEYKGQKTGNIELIFSLIFILSNWIFNVILGNIIYILCVLVFLFYRRQHVKKFIKGVRKAL